MSAAPTVTGRRCKVVAKRILMTERGPCVPIGLARYSWSSCIVHILVHPFSARLCWRECNAIKSGEEQPGAQCGSQHSTKCQARANHREPYKGSKMTASVRVNVEELIAFYDNDESVRPHSNSLKTLAGEELGFALLLKYFVEQQLRPALLESRCTAKGAWLDGWVSVQEPDQEVHYQVEVKSWSFHGYTGGQALGVYCTPDEIREFKISEWARYWDFDKQRFHAPGLDKVLKQMRPAHGAPSEVRPLACLWAAVHPEALDEPFFKVPAAATPFDFVWVFSMSSYLRNFLKLGGPVTMDLSMPKTSARLAHLNRIFSAAE